MYVHLKYKSDPNKQFVFGETHLKAKEQYMSTRLE